MSRNAMLQWPVTIYGDRFTQRFDNFKEAAEEFATNETTLLIACTSMDKFRGRFYVRLGSDTTGIEQPRRMLDRVIAVEWVSNPQRITVKRPAKKYTKTCERCENQWEASAKKSRFCSNSCSERAKGNNPKKEHTCINPGCGKKFLRYDPPALKHQEVKYCSVPCMVADTKRDLTDPEKAKQKERNKKWKKTPSGKASLHRVYLRRKERLKGGGDAK